MFVDLSFYFFFRDTLFCNDFCLDDMLKQFLLLKSTFSSCSLVPVYSCTDAGIIITCDRAVYFMNILIQFILPV